MKKALGIIISVVVCVYLIIVVFSTAFLLNRNAYGVSIFLGKNLLLVEDNLPEYKLHSLLVIDGVSQDKVEVGEKAFFYDTYSNDHKIKYEEVIRKEKVNEKETTYATKDSSVISSQYLIGTEKSTSELTTFGEMLYVIQSKWGFLLIVVFPLFLAFIYEIYAIYKEIKNK